MRCWQARRLATSRAEGPLAAADAARLDAHLARCPRCAEIAVEVELAWSALETVAEIEPGPDLAARIRARIASGEPASRGWVAPGWQRLALACTIVVALLVASQSRLSVETPPESEVAGLSRADLADDKLLRDVEASLNRWDTDYLPSLPNEDAWPSSLLDPSFQER